MTAGVARGGYEGSKKKFHANETKGEFTKLTPGQRGGTIAKGAIGGMLRGGLAGAVLGTAVKTHNLRTPPGLPGPKKPALERAAEAWGMTKKAFFDELNKIGW